MTGAADADSKWKDFEDTESIQSFKRYVDVDVDGVWVASKRG